MSAAAEKEDDAGMTKKSTTNHRDEMIKRLDNLRPFLGEHYGPTLPKDRMTDTKNLVFLRYLNSPNLTLTLTSP